jgi:hypothetical protein
MMAKQVEAELIVTPSGAVPETAAPSMLTLIQMAVDKGVPVETMEKLTALYVQAADRRAREEFAQALADFQAECPPIAKGSLAQIGSKFSFRYAELDQIAETIRPFLHKRGLSYTWDSETTDKAVRVKCILRHANGHSIDASFQAPIDARESMSGPQRVASTLTYARRQALVQVLGITTADPDDDARPAGTITDDQAATIQSLIDEVGADREKFLRFLGASAVSEIRAYDYNRAVKALESKRGRA